MYGNVGNVVSSGIQACRLYITTRPGMRNVGNFSHLYPNHLTVTVADARMKIVEYDIQVLISLNNDLHVAV